MTLWATPAGQEKRWLADWDVDLTQSEKQHFLRRVALLGRESTQRVINAVDQLRSEADDPDGQASLTSTVREWLAQR